jgi:crotonobetainyl-CoA:carnitine CoA-transferase CaiB-like acyl-CoA transferase
MTEGVFYMMGSLLVDYFVRGVVPRRKGMRLNGGSPDYNVYETSDGRYISIAAIEPWFWENLCRALGREDLVPHQLSSGDKRREIFEIFNDIFCTRTQDEWFEFLRNRDVSVGKVSSLDEVATDPQMIARGMVVEVEGPDGARVRQPGIAIRMSETPGSIRSTGAVTGQHTRQTLLSLGYTEDQIRVLCDREVVQAG